MKTTMQTMFKWTCWLSFVVIFGKPILAAIGTVLATAAAKLP